MVELNKLREPASRLEILIAFGILALTAIIGFNNQNADRHQAKVDACTSVLVNKQQLADVIGNSQSQVQAPEDPTLPEAIRKLIEEARAQQRQFLVEAQISFAQPLAICEEVGIESRVILKDSTGKELVPLPVPGSTTTTQPPPLTSSSQSVLGSPGPSGPAGPPGPAGPEGPGESTTTTSTTTPTPSTLLPCLTIVRSC